MSDDEAIKIVDNAIKTEFFKRCHISNELAEALGIVVGLAESKKEDRPGTPCKWFDCITDKILKARHGDYVLYKVDFLLDNLTREVYIMESARRMRGGQV